MSSPSLSKKHYTFIRSALFARTILAGAIVATAATAHAVNGTWNVDANGTWSLSDTSSWLDGTVAEGADFTANFSTVDITAGRTITLSAPLTIGNLIFGDSTNASHDWTLSSSPTSNVLTLDTTTGAPTINVVNRTAQINSVLAGSDGLTKLGTGTLILAGNNTFSGTTMISAGVLQIGADSNTGSVTGDIVNNATLRVRRGNAITLGGDITGTGSLTKLNSAGVLSLTGDNTFSGGTTLTDGAILLGTGTNNGLGTGTVTIGRGRLGSTDNASRTVNNTLSLGISGGLTLGAGQNATDGLGDLIFTDSSAGVGPGNGNAITVNNSTTVTLNKRFTGGQITKAGTGTLVLAGASTYTAATTINAGTLLVNNATGSGTGTGAITVAASGTLGGTGTTAPSGSNGLSVSGILAPGAGLGTLKIDLTATSGTLSILSGGGFKFELGAAGVDIGTAGTSDRLSIIGASALDVAFNGNTIDFGGTGAEGWYKLFDTDLASDSTWSGLTLSGQKIESGLSIANLGIGMTGELFLGNGTMGDADDIYLHVVPEPSTATALLGGIGVLLGSLRRRRQA